MNRRKKELTRKNLALEPVEPLIREIRGERVILDSDLARVYGVLTKRLAILAVFRRLRLSPDGRRSC